MRHKITTLMLAIVLVFSFSSLQAPAKKSHVKPQTQEELRKIQTKTYKNIPPNKVLKASLNILQDQYYFIEQADSGAGFILASREFDTRDKTINVKNEFGCSKKLTGIKRYSISRTETNINITPSENETIVRVSFRKKVLNMYDVAIRVKDITNTAVYEKFYSTLDQELQVKQ